MKKNGMYNTKMSLDGLFADVKEYFSPRIIGEVNDVYIKIAKIKGEDIPWHSHTGEDEMFYVLKGELTMEIRDAGSAVLRNGDVFVVRRDTEHRVYSKDECWIMLIENKQTKHTGEVESRITRSIDEQRY